MDLVPYIFHEQQEGNLCAQHCLNALLQGPYFTAIDLAELASQLDQQEQDALGNTGVGSREVKSQNMDDSGFFSVQVLSHALSIWNVQIIPWGAKEVSDAKSQPEREAAFICNLEQHWYTLRRFGPSTQRWYDLNSLHPRPQPMSAIYLSMTLSQLEQEGYSIFVVRPLKKEEESAASDSKQVAEETSKPSPTPSKIAASVPNKPEPEPTTSPVVPIAGQSTFLTERQEMERIRRKRLEDREKAAQAQQTTTETPASPGSTLAGTGTTTATLSDNSSSTQKRTRIDYLGDEVDQESRELNNNTMVLTKPFLPRCEVDDMAARMPIEDKKQKSSSSADTFGGAGYRLGGSPPSPPATESRLTGMDAPLPAEFMVTDQGEYVDQNDEDIERIMMEQAIAMSLLPDQSQQ
ncbi:Ataxin-3 [Entomortierella parvispora]|uniref:Ataxin-3 homolog n=1 Tax=Entomortierella parvispora TaxID=205924 RepID=A0A9P3LX91_9FUNG|nr:Ataxin-3 [Entomortierella parvispora]